MREQGAGKDAEWNAILADPLFSNASDGGSASLSHLVDIFVERHHALWKVGPLQRFARLICSLKGISYEYQWRTRAV